MHCVAREESSSPAIFSYFWIKTILKKTKRGDMLSLSWPGKLELQVNFCEIALNWILNWIIFQQNSKIELNQFGYQTGLPKTDWKILDTPQKSDWKVLDTPKSTKSDFKSFFLLVCYSYVRWSADGNCWCFCVQHSMIHTQTVQSSCLFRASCSPVSGPVIRWRSLRARSGLLALQQASAWAGSFCSTWIICNTSCV